MTGTRPLHGRRVHIAGSSDPATPRDRITYAHGLVRELTRRVLEQGGGLVVGCGKEPRAEGASPTDPSLVFDWTVLEEASKCVLENSARWPSRGGPPIIVVTSEKSEAEIPTIRRDLWQWLLDKGVVRIESIMPGARSAALLRERQASFGDCAVFLGGGTGVEHLAELYCSRRRSVIPLDLALGASRQDGMGGAERLVREARAHPDRFLQVDAQTVAMVNAQLAGLATRGGATPVAELVARLLTLLHTLSPSTAFYVRLLDPAHEDFPDVEDFFRNVVDPVVDELGFKGFEMGKEQARCAFMNVEIFERLHFASSAVVDMTGLRHNCLIELGYLLARGIPVLVTAKEGTKIPFDTDKIPCLFWKRNDFLGGSGSALGTFREFWERNVGRSPIIQ